MLPARLRGGGRLVRGVGVELRGVLRRVVRARAGHRDSSAALFPRPFHDTGGADDSAAGVYHARDTVYARPDDNAQDGDCACVRRRRLLLRSVGRV